MTRRGEKSGFARIALPIFIGFVALGLLVAALLKGSNIALFNPKGYIAGEQHHLLIFSVMILLAIAIPTLILFYAVAWRFRESNHKATHEPHALGGRALVFVIWALPFAIMVLLASVMWPATHRLAPRQAIAAGAKPITIEVVAMRWKWLFIYPEQNIATVNFVQIPVATPVQFVLTADETPMSSFWIPQLGGQLYAMTGHVNQLNLLANTAGEYAGRSAEINGAGFAGMTFAAQASMPTDFDSWVQSAKLSSEVLDNTEYNRLLKPSENDSVAVYSRIESNIFGNLLIKYNGPSGHAGH